MAARSSTTNMFGSTMGGSGAGGGATATTGAIVAPSNPDDLLEPELHIIGQITGMLPTPTTMIVARACN
jgi:hypothetical protein